MHTADRLEGHAPVGTFPERRENLQTISTHHQPVGSEQTMGLNNIFSSRATGFTIKLNFFLRRAYTSRAINLGAWALMEPKTLVYIGLIGILVLPGVLPQLQLRQKLHVLPLDKNTHKFPNSPPPPSFIKRF